MQLNDVDANLKYLALTLLILAVAAGYHNYTTDESDVMSFGMCDQSLTCDGIEAGGMCIGIERPEVTCMNPADAPDWRRAEAECGLDAQGICNENPDLTGYEWADDDRAEWDGRSCTAWEEETDVDLLPCEETFNDITQWTDTQ